MHHFTLGGQPLPGSIPPQVATDCGTWSHAGAVTDQGSEVTCPACRVVMQARRAKRKSSSASSSARRLTDSIIQRRRAAEALRRAASGDDD